MFIEGRIVDIRQDRETGGANILDGFDAQLEGCVIGIVWNECAHQCESSVAKRELNCGLVSRFFADHS